MIHLCTIATLMFLQNNTSQKILFIAARTIQFPGVVFKVCIYLIVAIVTSSIYFDVKSTHTYRKYIYQQSSCKERHMWRRWRDAYPDGGNLVTFVWRQSWCWTDCRAGGDSEKNKSSHTHMCIYKTAHLIQFFPFPWFVFRNVCARAKAILKLFPRFSRDQRQIETLGKYIQP